MKNIEREMRLPGCWDGVDVAFTSGNVNPGRHTKKNTPKSSALLTLYP